MISIDKLHASAVKITGLDDFGDQSYLEGLNVLVESYAAEASLTELGEKVQRAFLRGALVARALSEQAWKDNPGFSEVRIERPIFVLGLPRTGTTALHRLLTADPAHQGLELWLTDFPQPRPPRATWEDNPIFAMIQGQYQQHHLHNPEFMGLHYMDAAQVEECWQLLRQSVMSVSYECLAHIPSYSQWLRQQDWTPAYARHKRNLQLIGMPDAERRWVLKNPSHMFALNAILAVYPDALIVQTHRDPRTAIASVCSLNATASAGWSTVYEGAAVGRAQLDLWDRGLNQFNADRALHNPAQFVDVQYEDFVRDPLAAVESVYAGLGVPLSPEARSAMEALHTESQTGGRKPAHKYALSDFGLTEAAVLERFGS
ncbi:sulfotransferase family protein [Catelliglobosispora koreensis]|uniref:sulfotransferase family protein n=1 Tax=Catelliglobosispora koreensis TaxID=129052 RepID=UPI00037272B9|nr:sulfotransferase [Catelliglobosispora koreensis]